MKRIACHLLLKNEMVRIHPGRKAFYFGEVL